MAKGEERKNGTAESLQGIGVFTSKEALAAGISKPTLSRLVKRGILEKLGHGIYIHKDADWPEDIEFIIACQSLGPEALIGGLTALSYYAITEQVPNQTWLMVPNTKHGRYEKYRVLRTRHDPKVEVIDHGRWRIASIERAIVEAFTYATKIGYQTALSAARAAISEGKVTEQSLADAAKKLGEWPLIAKNWEAITTR